MAFDGSSGLAIVRTVTSTLFVAPPERQADVVAGLSPADLRAELRWRSDRCPVDGDDHVARVEDGRRRHVGRNRGDEHATGSCNDVVPQLAQRDDGGDFLRPLHVGSVLAVPLGVGLTGRREDLLGDEGRAVRTRERQELLEQADATHEEVDVVDVALGVRLATFDLDLVGERLGAIGNEEVVVGWNLPERERRDEAEHAQHDRRAGEALHC